MYYELMGQIYSDIGKTFVSIKYYNKIKDIMMITNVTKEPDEILNMTKEEE